MEKVYLEVLGIDVR